MGDEADICKIEKSRPEVGVGQFADHVTGDPPAEFHHSFETGIGRREDASAIADRLEREWQASTRL